MMAARMQSHYQSIRTFSHQTNSKRSGRETTLQDDELVKMYFYMLQNPMKLSSPFQKLLLHCPECITFLLDKHVLAINEVTNSRDKVYLDMEFFNNVSHRTESELSIVNLMFSKNRMKVMEHPIIEIMTQLKWKRVWFLFVLAFMIQLFFTTVSFGFALVNFSEQFANNGSKKVLNIILALSSILRIVDSFLQIGSFSIKLWRRKKNCKKISLLENISDMYELFFIFNNFFGPILALISIGMTKVLLFSTCIKSFQFRYHVKRDNCCATDTIIMASFDKQSDVSKIWRLWFHISTNI